MTEKIQYADIDMRLAQLREPRDGVLYYAITIIGDDDGEIICSFQTHWVGWHNEDHRFELRKPRYVYGKFAKMFWADSGQPYAIINEAEDLPLFLVAGGHALIAVNVANEGLAEWLGPDPVAHDGPAGFKSLETCNAAALKRAPTVKLRMSIINRDGRRCRICGRRPDDYVDIELHVHHIRPWARGGLTESQNLITLCHTCHNGLKPHEDLTLYEYTAPNSLTAGSQQILDKLVQGIISYRRIIHGTD